VKVSQSLEHYSATLASLEEARPLSSAEQILAILKARNRVQIVLKEETQDNTSDLVGLVKLDKRLKQQTMRMVQVVKQETAKGTEVSYPRNPPLVPGVSHRLRVESDNGKSSILGDEVEVIRWLEQAQADYRALGDVARVDQIQKQITEFNE
jgi:hypothetical protein